MVDVGAQETSSVVVETVPKVAKAVQGKGPVLPAFKSDASKVSSKGMGLKKAYIGKQNQFTVTAADAGKLKFWFLCFFFYRLCLVRNKHFVCWRTWTERAV